MWQQDKVELPPSHLNLVCSPPTPPAPVIISSSILKEHVSESVNMDKNQWSFAQHLETWTNVRFWSH